MKITKKQLRQIIKEELSNTLKLKESISVEAWDILEAVLRNNQEVFRLAYQDLINSHSPDQIDADTGEPVDSDPHTEAMKQIMSLIEPYLTEEEDPWERGASWEDDESWQEEERDIEGRSPKGTEQ
jgi:hypothetical protein